MIRFLITSVLTAMLAACASNPTSMPGAGAAFTLEQAASAHPVQMYKQAERLFKAGDRDEAAFWFYAGQLRYRVHLAARPNLPPDKDPAVFASMNATLGQQINEYIAGDPAAWEAVIQRALDWDARTPNHFTPKARYASAYRNIRSGLEEMRAYIHANHDLIRRERAAAGLENR